MKIEYMIYVVTDKNGHKDAAVADDPSDTVQICGIVDAEGDSLYFEDEAYHLESGCKVHGLGYNCIKMDAHV